MENNPSVKRWQDQVILLLGLWFFITPWVFGYPMPSVQTWTAFISGAVIVLLAAFDLYKTYFWAVVLNLVVGVWVALSPWILRIADNTELVWNSLVVGAAVGVLAIWEMRTDPELVKHWPGARHAT
jgi:hypothetical protein